MGITNRKTCKVVLKFNKFFGFDHVKFLFKTRLVYIYGRKNYALSVTAVFYGDVRVGTSINGLGEAIFDSGTSYTYLIPPLYDAILASVRPAPFDCFLYLFIMFYLVDML
jgi:hypothetical protein